MKKYIEKILFILAKLILSRHHPQVIGITGSVGKTSAKEAIFSVLKTKYNVRTNYKNYNNEIGLPLTIIGASSYGKNIFGWIWVIIKALGVIAWPKYQEILILEMGADKPGDIKYLTNLAPCNIGVLTAIGSQPVHLENYKNLDQLIKEKGIIATHLSDKDFAIINVDDKQIQSISDKIKAQIFSLGNSEAATIRVSDINYSLNLENDSSYRNAGINFKVHYQGNTVPFHLSNVLGMPSVYAGLNAIAVGLIYKMNLVEIASALQNYQAPVGRLNIIPGIKDTVIIDDSYNSSPLACRQAIELLNKVSVTGRKIACLGNMAELGSESKKAHREIGRLIQEYNIDILFAIGDQALEIASAALEKGMNKDHVFTFPDSDSARKTVQDEIHCGDVILIKGSQSVRTEKITLEIMAEPQKASELLVRQDKSWK
ncbi:MAG: UDP-N-acetylmuramoyl-tripeptide--D-alanyl-D-alanine ligase [Patescibacteria group bacterium]